MIVCDELVKKYYSCTAVDHVNVRLDDGKVYALLGPNGSGKTTLMKMIMGLIKPNGGTILLDGHPLNAKSKADIVYMPTENYFYPYMTVKDIVKFYNDFYQDFSEQRLYDIMGKMGLSFNDKVKNMSTGMLAKLKIAVALSRDARIIMLDEPLNGIDILAREVIIGAIRANAGGNRTIVVSSHLVDELENIVDGALFMKNGQMVLAGDAVRLREVNHKSLVELYREVYGYGYNSGYNYGWNNGNSNQGGGPYAQTY